MELKEIDALQRAQFIDFVKESKDDMRSRIRQMSLLVLMSSGEDDPTTERIDEYARSFKGETGFQQLQDLAQEAIKINALGGTEEMEKNSGPSLSVASHSG